LAEFSQLPGFVLIGHSHVTGLAKVAAAERRDARVFVGAARHGGGAFPVAAGVTPELQAVLTPDVVVLSCIGGNAHNIMALLAHDPPFDFVCPAEPHLPLDADAEILSQAAVRDTLKRRASKHMDLFHKVAASARGPVFHAESPPPSPPHERFLSGLAQLTDRRPATPRLRYKIWRLHSAIVREACDEAGVTFIPHPSRSTDDVGMLLPRYYLNPTHANAAYARLVWRQLEALL
jgi:hypothetical protein